MHAKAPPQLGAIRNDETYPLPLFQRLTGLSAWALRTARTEGLKMRVVGRRKYIIGSDWLAYLQRQEG